MKNVRGPQSSYLKVTAYSQMIALLLSGTLAVAASPEAKSGTALKLVTSPLIAAATPVSPVSTITSQAVSQLSTLRSAVKSGKVTFKVQGDGVTTSSVRLLLTNTTNAPVRLVIPANEVLHPNAANVQTMMFTKDMVVTLPVGQVAIVVVPAVCADVKTIPPPPKEGVSFDIGPYADPKIWRQLSAIMAASDELERTGLYSGVPINKDQGRKEQIAQLAVWRLLGLASGKPEHAITPETIEADLLRAVADQVKKNPALLQQLGGGYEINSKGELVVAARQKKAIDERVNSIFNAVDLTVRRAEDPTLEHVASLPEDSTFDTYVNVGERAYQGGDYVEAEELLGQALQEAEGFGEVDPRLSRCLTSLGRCYLDLSWWEKAETLFSRALSLREKVSGPTSPEVADIKNCLGLIKQQQQLYGSAEQLFQGALNILEKAAGSTSKVVAEVLNNLGKNFYLQDNASAAEPLLKRSLAIMMLDQQQIQDKSSVKIPSTAVAEVETNLANAYCRSGKYPEAKALYQKALAIDSRVLGEEHPYVASILDGLAYVSTQQDQKEAAELFKKQAESIREKTLGKENQQIALLPLGTDALTRIKLYTEGAKQIMSSVESVKASARTVAGSSIDKTRVNRPIKDKWALVIGVSKFQDPTINLKFAAKDAQDFANFLIKEAKFAPDHVRLLTDENATRENILAQIGDKWLPRVANPDDLVLIFISSHGSPSKVDLNGVNYLVAHNTDKNSLYATGVPMQELTHMIKDRVHSDRVVLMMDACHSGAANPAGKGIFRISNFNADELAQGSGQLVICSSEPTQTSWESKRYANGVFTHYLMDGLRANAGMTKLGDAFKYMQDKVQEEVLRDRGELQTPLLKSKWEGDDLILATPPTQSRPGLEEEQIQPLPNQVSPMGEGKSAGGISTKAAPKPATRAIVKPAVKTSGKQAGIKTGTKKAN